MRTARPTASHSALAALLSTLIGSAAAAQTPAPAPGAAPTAKPPAHTAAPPATDSGAVFALAVDQTLLARDPARLWVARAPRAAWAAASLQRYRAAPADPNAEPITLEAPRFRDDSAWVTVSYVYCHPKGFNGGAEVRYPFVRTAGVWKATGNWQFTHYDGTCRPAPR